MSSCWRPQNLNHVHMVSINMLLPVPPFTENTHSQLGSDFTSSDGMVHNDLKGKRLIVVQVELLNNDLRTVGEKYVWVHRIIQLRCGGGSLRQSFREGIHLYRHLFQSLCAGEHRKCRKLRSCYRAIRKRVKVVIIPACIHGFVNV